MISPLPPPKGGIATWTESYKESNILKEHKLEIVNIAVGKKRQKDANRLYLVEEIKRTISILKTVKKKIKKSKFDVAHINSACSILGLYRDYICIKIIKKRKINTFVHFHCDVSYMVKCRFQRYIIKRILKMVDGTIVLNKSSYEYIRGINENIKVTIIPNFIDDEFTLKKDKEIEDEIKNILYVGRICKEKGSDVILEVAKDFPNIQFRMIGKVSQDFCNRKKLDNVIFDGEKGKKYVIDELKKADLFIFPTLTEGFPCALLEAMAEGLPVITTRVGAIEDMLEDYGGIYCRINETEDFIKAIEQLKDKEQRKKMSRWNIKKVKENYLQENVIKEIIDLYKGERY